MENKTCKSCAQCKPLSEFYKDRTRKDGMPSYRAECKACVKKRVAAHRKTHPGSAKRRSLKYYRKIRLRALLHYSDGDLQCACCGERIIEFLTLDHLDNNGAQHRRELLEQHTDIFHWVHRNNYPNGFQVLCMNCNFAKGIHGQCVHELMRQGTYVPLDIENYLKRTRTRNNRSRLLTYQGETHTMTEWGEILGISARVLSTRLNNHGWNVHRTFTQPVRKHRS